MQHTAPSGIRQAHDSQAPLSPRLLPSHPSRLWSSLHSTVVLELNLKLSDLTRRQPWGNIHDSHSALCSENLSKYSNQLKQSSHPSTTIASVPVCPSCKHSSQGWCHRSLLTPPWPSEVNSCMKCSPPFISPQFPASIPSSCPSTPVSLRGQCCSACLANLS